MIEPLPPNGNPGIIPPWLQWPIRIMENNLALGQNLIDHIAWRSRPATYRQTDFTDGYEGNVPPLYGRQHPERAHMVGQNEYQKAKAELAAHREANK